MNKIKAPAREGFLYHLWLDRQFDGINLHTIENQPVEIVEKGIRNYDAGPDFLNALLRFGEKLERGDVEIHPIAGDWYAHGHHRDPRYNNVILHLVTMDCPGSFRTIRQDGALIPTLNLDSFLEKTAEELEVETTVEKEPVRSCALSQKDSLLIQHILEKAGDHRYAIKKNRFAEQRQLYSWDQLIYQAVLEALGYAKNQIPFRQLADALPIETLWSFIWNDPPEQAQTKCEAYLFGAAGLLPSQQHGENVLSPVVRAYTNTLEAYWLDFPLRPKIDVLKPGVWQFFRLRPVNFPTRRVASAAVLCVRFMNDGFVRTLERIVSDLENSPHKIYKEFEHRFTVTSHNFWSNHFSFEESRAEFSGKKEACLLGTERARNIVINVVLPGLSAYAKEIDDFRLHNILQEIYNNYPLANDNELTRSMHQQLFGVSKRSDIVSSARLQQGLIHIKKEMCEPHECSICIEKLDS